MRNKFLIRIFIVILITSIPVLSMGCGNMSKGQREKRLKELLREKYGEEFEIRELYDTGAIHAWCYPIKNQNMIFMADTKEEMDRLISDYYLQKIVCNQIDTELTEEFQQVYKTFFISSYFSSRRTDNYFTYYKKSEISIQTLVHYFRIEKLDDSITINIFIDREAVDNSLMTFEYEKIVDIIRKEQGIGDNPTVFVYLYFCDDVEMQSAKEAIGKYDWRDSENSETDIYDVRKNIPRIELLFDENGGQYMFIDDEKVELNVSNYIKQREDL